VDESFRSGLLYFENWHQRDEEFDQTVHGFPVFLIKIILPFWKTLSGGLRVVSWEIRFKKWACSFIDNTYSFYNDVFFT
jgi:hypothetical protein